MSAAPQDNHTGRSSLISRLAASTALLAAAVVVLAFFSYHAIRGATFNESFETPLDEWSEMMSREIGSDPEIARAAARNHKMGVMLMLPDKDYAFGPNGESIEPNAFRHAHAGDRHIYVQTHTGANYSFFFTQGELDNKDNSLLFGLIGGLLSVVGVVYLVQLRQLRPLRWLREGVARVSNGDLSTRVPVIRMDEIGQVGQAFNHMTERFEQILNDHDRLMADVSHELRSPLARIKLALEMMPEGEKRDLIANDIREMEALTAALLERERIKHRTAQPDHKEFDIVAVVQQIVKSFDGQEPGVSLLEAPETLAVEADEALIKVLLQNLIDNSVKFSLNDSGPVEIRLVDNEGFATVTVDDDGRGIPEDMTDRVLEPFVKLDPARGHRSGYGLGLNLCQRIVQAHNGSMTITARQPRGTRVSVTLTR